MSTGDEPTRVQVAVAVVEHAGRYLVGTRGAGAPLAGYAEFPGGKCAPGEPSEVCAVRECLEETGLRVDAVRPLVTTNWQYPHAAVRLHFWLCQPVSHAAPRSPFRWVTPAELARLQFPEANAAILALLMASA